ncbi:MAG: hypothetical protein ACE5I9_00720, partial [Candidatus Methylomirabilales bacterium]
PVASPLPLLKEPHHRKLLIPQFQGRTGRNLLQERNLPGICTVNRRDLLGNEAVGGRNLSNSGSHHIIRSGKGRARRLQAWG